MQLTSSAPPPDSPIIRTGCDGRLRYSPEQRQSLLDAFDRGGQSALAFSKHHGVCYQTWTNNDDNTLTVSGAISGSGFGITKAGTGTLVLGGNNTCSGATAVDASKLVVSGSIGNSAVSVSNAGTAGWRTGGPNFTLLNQYPKPTAFKPCKQAANGS